MRKKNQNWRGSQGTRKSARRRDSQVMRGNKKSRASPKVREEHTVRASQNPRPSQRASCGLLKSAQLKIMCSGKQSEKQTGGLTTLPRAIRRTYKKGIWAVKR